MLLAYRPIACCLFLLSYLFIVYFCIYVFFLRCYHYLVNKDVYIRQSLQLRLSVGISCYSGLFAVHPVVSPYLLTYLLTYL